MKKILLVLGVVPQTQLPIILYCDNNGVVVQSIDPKNHKGGKHIERKYHLIREIVQHEDVVVTMIASADNLVDPFTKALTSNIFHRHVDRMVIRYDILWT